MTIALFLAAGCASAKTSAIIESAVTQSPAAPHDDARPGMSELRAALVVAELVLGSPCDHRGAEGSPEQIAKRFVEEMEHMRLQAIELHDSAQAFGWVGFRLARPDGPWQVAVVPDAAGRRFVFEGYGATLSRPLLVREAPCLSPVGAYDPPHATAGP